MTSYRSLVFHIFCFQLSSPCVLFVCALTPVFFEPRALENMMTHSFIHKIQEIFLLTLNV